MKKLLIIAGFLFPLSVSAAEVKYLTCTATYHSVEADGSDHGLMIGNDIKLRDIGTSFSVTIGETKFISSSLVPIKQDGKTALVGEKDGYFFTKIDGNYVIMKDKKGYVISDCK